MFLGYLNFLTYGLIWSAGIVAVGGILFVGIMFTGWLFDKLRTYRVF